MIIYNLCSVHVRTNGVVQRRRMRHDSASRRWSARARHTIAPASPPRNAPCTSPVASSCACSSSSAASKEAAI